MDIIQLLEHPIIIELAIQNNHIKKEKKQATFNLFTISSYNAYLENFHSDIIASLLNPNGLHNQKYTFLNLFINYLNTYYKTDISFSDFQNTIVTRETGRLDIWIRDEISKQSIIIENKINNAVDMDEQIDRYFAYSQHKRKYKVKAVVYLTLDGTKKAPPTVEHLDDYIKNIGAFTNCESDFVNGWLLPSYSATDNLDSSTFIHQYINLIKHLANKSMDNNIMELFYQFLNTENALNTARTVVELSDKIAVYRADKFSNAISNYAPFKKQFRYYPYYWLYENYREGNNNFKLDIWFLNNGNAELVFWNPGVSGVEGRKAVTEKLEKINLLNEFSIETKYDNGYPKHFIIGEEYKSMQEVDVAIITFVQQLMKGLNTEK